MARFQVDTEKQYLTEYWTNRYFVEAEDITAAQGIGNQIIQAEILCHYDLVNFTKYRVSTTTKGDDEYIIAPINIHGVLQAMGAQPLPLFNCARVDFAVSSGRPSRKYLRTGMTSAGVQGSNLHGDHLNAINTYATTLAALNGFVDVDGQQVIFGVVFLPIAMRQLRRGTKQKKQPILP